MKKFVSLLLAFSLALCLAACGGSASSAVSGSAASSEAASSEAASSEAAQELSTTDALRIAGLKGPTTMGLVNLLSMEADGTAAMDYDLQLYGAADEIVPLLMKGELDMAAIPANLAATTDLDGTAALCEEQGVVAKAAIAKKALPNCNIVCLTGDELKADASAYLQVLFDADPAAVGGALPGDDFYWTAE